MTTSTLFKPKSQQALTDNHEYSPILTYFIEKLKGNEDLTSYEDAALKYIETHESKTPPDAYFRQKWNMAHEPTGGIVPPYVEEGILNSMEKEAIDYTRSVCPELQPASPQPN